MFLYRKEQYPGFVFVFAVCMWLLGRKQEGVLDDIEQL